MENTKLYNSRKDFINDSYIKNYNTSITNKVIFLTQENINNVVASVYSIHTQYGLLYPIEYFSQNIPKLMRKWAIEKNINSFENLNTSVDNFLTTLDFINKLFIKDHLHMFIENSSYGNYLFEEKIKYAPVQVGSINEFDNTIQTKELSDLLASDYNSIDVWKNIEIDRWNNNYRDRNKIGMDKISRHVRDYDKREQDGMRATVKNSSRENNHQRGFGIAYEEFVNNVTNKYNRNENIRLPDI